MRGRADFAALTEVARAIAPTVTLGFADTLDDGRVRVLYSYPYGVGAYVPQGAIEWHLLFGGVQRVVATRAAELLLDRLC